MKKIMTALFLALAAGASAQTDAVKPNPATAAKSKRMPLDCKNAASIRDFKAAVVEDSGWDHSLAEEWARYACPKEADEAGWPEPRPVLPAKWRGALPARDKNPNDHAWSVKSLIDGFLLYPQRPLPITRKQAEVIAEGWHRRRNADLPDIDKLGRQVKEAGDAVDKIDQPVGETKAQRRKRLGLAPK